MSQGFIPRRILLTDNMATPVVEQVGAFIMLYDGSQWDAARSVALGQTTKSASLPVTLASDTGTLTVDTELPAAATLADSTSNPTVPGMAGFGMNFDGVEWFRKRGDNLGSYIQGNNLHGDTDNGRPLKVGGKAKTSRPSAVSDAQRADGYFDEYGRQVMRVDTYYRSDTFTATGNGTTVDVTSNPLRTFTIQVKMTGTVTSWDVRMEGSLDGTNFFDLAAHTNVTPGDGLAAYGVDKPVRYFRSRCAGLALGAGTNVIAHIIGVP